MKQMLSPTAARYMTDLRSNVSPPENFEQAKRRLYCSPLKSTQSLVGGGGNVRAWSTPLSLSLLELEILRNARLQSTISPFFSPGLRADLTVVVLAREYGVQGDSRQEYKALLKEHDAISRSRPQEAPPTSLTFGGCSTCGQKL